MKSNPAHPSSLLRGVIRQFVSGPRHGAALLAVAVAVTAVATFGCGDETDDQPQMDEFDFPVEVEATDQEDEPVAGVPVLVDDRLVGFTDADGVFEATLSERPLETLRLSVEQPPGYRTVSDETSLEEQLQLVESLDGDIRGIPLTLRVQYESTLVEHLVWLDLDCEDGLDDEFCEDVPVILDDEPRSRTDRRGRAHFTFEGVPGEIHDVDIPITPRPDEPEDDEDDAEAVDDRDLPEIEPADPRYELRATSEPTVYHLQEQFTDPDARPTPSPSPGPSPAPAPSPDPPAEPDEPDEPTVEESDDGEDDSDIIDLF